MSRKDRRVAQPLGGLFDFLRVLTGAIGDTSLFLNLFNIIGSHGLVELVVVRLLENRELISYGKRLAIFLNLYLLKGTGFHQLVQLANFNHLRLVFYMVLYTVGLVD